MEAVPALGRLGHEDCEFDPSIDCIVSLKKKILAGTRTY